MPSERLVLEGRDAQGNQVVTTLDVSVAAAAPAVVFGSSRPDNSAGMAAPVASYRTYLAAGKRPTTLAGDSGLTRAAAWLPADGLLWLSHKDDAGPWLRSLLTDITTRKPGWRILLTASHEPYDNFWPNDVATWHAKQDLMEAIAAEFPAVQPIIVLEGYRRPSNNPAYYDAMRRPGQTIGFDAYNPGIETPTAYANPASIFDELLAYAQSKGQQRLYIGETGTGLTPADSSGAGRRAWLTSVRSYLTTRAEVALWWNQGGCILPGSELRTWTG